jgi:hypothetical protein
MTDFDVSDLSDDLGNGLGDGLSINAGSWVSGLSNTQRFKLLVAQAVAQVVAQVADVKISHESTPGHSLSHQFRACRA